MPSPCVRICVYDASRGLCRGCGRTLAEIQDWWTMREEEQLRIMAELPGRLLKPEPPPSAS